MISSSQNNGGSPNVFHARNLSKLYSNNSNSNELAITEYNEPGNLKYNTLNCNATAPNNNNVNHDQGSFLFNNKNGKAPKIPLLNLPQTNSENVGTMTRSTRRADPFKSFSTNSNRFSNSIDSGFKD